MKQPTMCEHCGSHSTRQVSSGVFTCLNCKGFFEDEITGHRVPKARRQRFDDDE